MKSSLLLPSFFGISKAIDSSLIPTISNCEPDFILTEPYARLTSEGYPGAEYPIKNCTWLLKGPESSTIKILVEHAELESSIDPETNELMCIDFLEMEDQNDAANYQVVCDVKRDSPKNQYSTSNDIILSLTQDERLVDAGFSLIYEIVNDIEYSCDFNVGICRGWIISSSFPNKWTLQKGRPSTMTIGTGPNTDVEGNGYYLISDASQPRIPGDSAVILSPKFPGGKKLCLSSFYHMFGTDMGTLYFVVEKIQQTSNTAETPPPFQIYTIEGNQGDTWKRIGYEIILDNDVDQEYVLQIMSRIGPGYLSDIAIDNIRIEFVDYMDPCPFPTSDGPNTNPTNFPLLVQTTDMITKLLEPTNFPMTTAFDITTKADNVSKFISSIFITIS